MVGRRALEASLIHSPTHTHLPFVLNLSFLVSDLFTDAPHATDTMSWLASALLSLIHALYRLVLVFQSVFRPATEPQPITAERSKLPQHLALALVPNPEADDEANEQYLLNSVEKVAGWCQLAGIRRLSVYDREGMCHLPCIPRRTSTHETIILGVLSRSSIELRGRLQPASRKAEPEDSPVECDIQYPLTPPPSDDAESRPLSPHSGNVVPKLGVTTIRLHAESPKPKRRVSALKRRRIPRQSFPAAFTVATSHVYIQPRVRTRSLPH